MLAPVQWPAVSRQLLQSLMSQPVQPIGINRQTRASFESCRSSVEVQ